VILGDPAHKIVNANLYQVDEVLALYARITAPGAGGGGQRQQLGQWWQGRYGLAEYHERLKSVPNLQHAVVTDAATCCTTTSRPSWPALIEGFCA
jgi:hypothetical protein